MKQTFVARLSIILRLFQKHVQICPAALPAFHRQNQTAVFALDHFKQQIIDRRVSRFFPVICELFQKYFYLSYKSRIPLFSPVKAAQRLIEAACFRFAANDCQLLIRKIAKRRTHGSSQRNVLQRIIDHPQKFENRPDFHSGKISRGGRHMHRNPLCRDHIFKRLIPTLVRPKQDDNIRIPRRAQTLFLLIPDALRMHQLIDAFGDCLCLQLPVRYFLIGCKQQKLCLIVSPLRFRIIRPVIKRRRVVIFDISKLLFHNMPKNFIDRIEHLFPAAEIMVQVNPLPVAFFFGIGVVFFHKKRGPCKPEAVNALLDIAHHK